MGIFDVSHSEAGQGWAQISRNEWHRLEGYRGAPTAIMADTAIGWMVESYLMRPPRRLVLPSSLSWSDVVLQLHKAEKGEPDAPAWLPQPNYRTLSLARLPDFRVIPGRGLRRIGGIIDGRAVVVVEVSNGFSKPLYAAMIDSHPLTDEKSQTCLFGDAAGAVCAARYRIHSDGLEPRAEGSLESAIDELLASDPALERAIDEFLKGT